MRQAHNARRSRGRSNRKHNGPLKSQNFESNGPDVRIRGNAHQVYEKYLALARDAGSSGDRISAEGYFQHAEHYFRIMNDSTDPQSNRPQRPRENGRDSHSRDESQRDAAQRDESARGDSGRSDSGRGDSGRGERAGNAHDGADQGRETRASDQSSASEQADEVAAQGARSDLEPAANSAPEEKASAGDSINGAGSNGAKKPSRRRPAKAEAKEETAPANAEDQDQPPAGA